MEHPVELEGHGVERALVTSITTEGLDVEKEVGRKRVPLTSPFTAGAQHVPIVQYRMGWSRENDGYG